MGKVKFKVNEENVAICNNWAFLLPFWFVTFDWVAL
jgi:hypothetical protein